MTHVHAVIVYVFIRISAESPRQRFLETESITTMFLYMTETLILQKEKEKFMITEEHTEITKWSIYNSESTYEVRRCWNNCIEYSFINPYIESFRADHHIRIYLLIKFLLSPLFKFFVSFHLHLHFVMLHEILFQVCSFEVVE